MFDHNMDDTGLLSRVEESNCNDVVDHIIFRGNNENYITATLTPK